MYRLKELDRIEEDLPNINKSRTTEIILQSLINSCRSLYRILNRRNKQSIFVVTQLHKRQGLAACQFEAAWKDGEDYQAFPFESPAWNSQTDQEFTQSAIATAFCAYARSQGYEVTLEKKE